MEFQFLNRKVFFLLVISSILMGCEKEITIDLPEAEPKLVVEGFIEQGFPPVVILSESRGFFEAVDSASLKEVIVTDADVVVNDGVQDYPLSFISFGGLSGYSSINLTGQIGKTYTLKITRNGELYTSKTTILPPVPTDSLWFEPEKPGDSLGYIWAYIYEPQGLGDGYRWYAQRLGKDPYPIAPRGSVFDDQFVDGKYFKFGYSRGILTGSQAPDDFNRERGYFKRGDTVVVRFCHLEKSVHEFLLSYEVESLNSSNPFTTPANIKTNIEGGALGYWGGYGCSYDTLICK